MSGKKQTDLYVAMSVAADRVGVRAVLASIADGCEEARRHYPNKRNLGLAAEHIRTAIDLVGADEKNVQSALEVLGEV